MKKLFPTALIGLSIMIGGLSASQINENEDITNTFSEYSYLRVYGLGLQIGDPVSNTKDESYSGVGVQFENDFSNVVLESGKDYTKAAGVLKYDLTNYLYVKGGLGYLEREMSILGVDKDVTQVTVGASLGYGDEKSYNIEAGYLDSELDNAASADGHSKISYIEVVGKHTFAKYATFDAVGIYSNTNVFSRNYSENSAELGWYATDDVRTFASYDSVSHDKNDYAVRAGIQYAFASGEFSPYLRASTNTNKHVIVGVEYYKGITNKSLKMRDFFENAVRTYNIVAQDVAPEEFATKVSKKTPAPVAGVSPSITMPNQSITVVPSQFFAIALADSPTVTNVVGGATYSIVDPSTRLNVNVNTGAMFWSGNTPAVSTDFDVTLRVTNPDGSTAAVVFTLSVIIAAG